jgi:hypothetical protein
MTRVLHTDADAGAATPEIQKNEKKFFLSFPMLKYKGASASNDFFAITVSAPIRAPARLSISGQMPRRWISF